MPGAIAYINTDLDLRSMDDLTPLVSALHEQGVFPLGVTRGDDGIWIATLETQTQYDAPEPNIAAMVGAIEALPAEMQPAWARCSVRDFNIGYDCGDHPWGFTQALSPTLLGRAAALGAAIRITIYPEREAVASRDR